MVFMTDLITPSADKRTWEPALSASRAKEYERCPLQYRLHVLDGYREPETRAKALGTIVHAVLENLFALPAQERTPDAARGQVWLTRPERQPARATLTRRCTSCVSTRCFSRARRCFPLACSSFT